MLGLLPSRRGAAPLSFLQTAADRLRDQSLSKGLPMVPNVKNCAPWWPRPACCRRIGTAVALLLWVGVATARFAVAAPAGETEAGAAQPAPPAKAHSPQNHRKSSAGKHKASAHPHAKVKAKAKAKGKGKAGAKAATSPTKAPKNPPPAPPTNAGGHAGSPPPQNPAPGMAAKDPNDQPRVPSPEATRKARAAVRPMSDEDDPADVDKDGDATTSLGLFALGLVTVVAGGSGGYLLYKRREQQGASLRTEEHLKSGPDSVFRSSHLARLDLTGRHTVAEESSAALSPLEAIRGRQSQTNSRSAASQARGSAAPAAAKAHGNAARATALQTADEPGSEALAKPKVAEAANTDFERYVEIDYAVATWSGRGEDVTANLKKSFQLSKAQWERLKGDWQGQVAKDKALGKKAKELVKSFQAKYAKG